MLSTTLPVVRSWANVSFRSDIEDHESERREDETILVKPRLDSPLGYCVLLLLVTIVVSFLCIMLCSFFLIGTGITGVFDSCNGTDDSIAITPEIYAQLYGYSGGAFAVFLALMLCVSSDVFLVTCAVWVVFTSCSGIVHVIAFTEYVETGVWKALCSDDGLLFIGGIVLANVAASFAILAAVLCLIIIDR